VVKCLCPEILRKRTGELKIPWNQASSDQLAKSHEVHNYVLGENSTALHENPQFVLSTDPKI